MLFIEIRLWLFWKLLRKRPVACRRGRRWTRGAWKVEMCYPELKIQVLTYFCQSKPQKAFINRILHQNSHSKPLMRSFPRKRLHKTATKRDVRAKKPKQKANALLETYESLLEHISLTANKEIF